MMKGQTLPQNVYDLNWKETFGSNNVKEHIPYGYLKNHHVTFFI